MQAIATTAVLLVLVMALSARGQTHDGYHLPPGWEPPVMDRGIHSFTLIERFEWRGGDGAEVLALDAQGWLGGDHHRFWWKTDAEQSTRGAKSGEFEIQALYSRLISPFWDAQAGIRLDRIYRGQVRRTDAHLAFGLQGLAPYRFEVEPALFLSEDGDVTLRFNAQYDLLLTQRWILSPRIDLAAALQDQPERDERRGFTQVEFGLRLRYDISRQFSPYVGATFRRALGATAGARRAAGEEPGKVAAVIGVRAWF